MGVKDYFVFGLTLFVLLAVMGFLISDFAFNSVGNAVVDIKEKPFSDETLNSFYLIFFSLFGFVGILFFISIKIGFRNRNSRKKINRRFNYPQHV